MTRFLSIVVALAAAACGTHATPKSDIDPRQASKPAVVEAPDAPTEYVAIVTSKRSEVLPAGFAGRVSTVLVRTSQNVHKDELIAKQDTTELKSKLVQAKAMERSHRAAAGRSGAMAGAAALELRSATMLATRGSGTRIAIAEARAKVNESGAGAGADEASADADAANAGDIQTKIDHAEIKAPFDGQISNVRVKDGDSVSAGAPIARIFDPSDLIVRFAVPQGDKTPLKNGMKVQLKLPDQDQPIWAVIIEINDEIEPPINYRLVTADIDDSKLRPGEVTLSSIGRVTIASAKPTTKGKPQ